MRDACIAAGTPRDLIYPPIYQALAVLLAVAFIANLTIRPVAKRFHSVEEIPELARGQVAVNSNNDVPAPRSQMTMIITLC